MTWEKLIRKLEALSEFFSEEYSCIPNKLTPPVPVTVRLLFSREDGKKRIPAEMRLYKDGRIAICSQKKLSVGLETMLVDPIKIHSSDVNSIALSSYEDFARLAEEMFCKGFPSLVVSLRQDNMGVILEQAYYDLRRKIYDLFKRVNEIACEDDIECWRAKRQLLFTQRSLREIMKTCEVSQELGGATRILENIRMISTQALLDSTSAWIEARFIPSLPPD